jgi:predicted TIM-barrel fold metal-dependent hydrolase
MTIDANMYWFPEEWFQDDSKMELFLSDVPTAYGWHGYVKETEDHRKQVVLEKPKGCPNLNYVQGDYVLEKQLADMDQAGVDKAVLKAPGCHEWLSLPLCRMFNDGMRAHAERSKGRLIPLAVVPPAGGREQLRELERCKRELGMNAVQLCAHYGERYLDDERFAAFFEALNELKMTAYVHHTPVPVEYACFSEYNNLRRSYGRCVDQGIAVGRELFSGFFDKYPHVRMVHSMLGGGFFAIANMMFPPKPQNPDAALRFDSGKGDSYRRFKENMYFEMSHAQPWGKAQLECAIAVLGADHVLFGTSYPVRKEWLFGGPDFIARLSISEEEKELILGKNAIGLYHIE